MWQPESNIEMNSHLRDLLPYSVAVWAKVIEEMINTKIDEGPKYDM